MFRCIYASASMLALSASIARGSVQDRISESRIPVSASAERGFAGEIGYAFDTARNITTARFKTSLAPRGIFSRIFRGSPPVHTLTAAYEFAGRGAGNAPDSIRISLVSDEFSVSFPGNGLPPLPEPVLTVILGDSVARLPLGISQKTQLWWPHDSLVRAVRSPEAGSFGMNFSAPAPQMHIQRTATVRLSTCAFFALLSGENVHGTVAGLDFELNKEVLAGLRVFAAETGSSTAAPASVSCRSR